MVYLEKTIPIKEYVCGNCQYWEKCKGDQNPAIGQKRKQEDYACSQIMPVVVNGEVIAKHNSL